MCNRWTRNSAWVYFRQRTSAEKWIPLLFHSKIVIIRPRCTDKRTTIEKLLYIFRWSYYKFRSGIVDFSIPYCCTRNDPIYRLENSWSRLDLETKDACHFKEMWTQSETIVEKIIEEEGWHGLVTWLEWMELEHHLELCTASKKEKKEQRKTLENMDWQS